MPPATGNVDDAVNALLQEADAEEAAVGNASDDKASITSDDQTNSDFSQSANENDF